jgi:hypothetical protein
VLLLILPAAFALAGLAIGRWWVVATALATWIALAVYLYANNGWYGSGWGDFGIALNVISAAASVLGAALGVGLRYLARSARTRGNG